MNVGHCDANILSSFAAFSESHMFRQTCWHCWHWVVFPLENPIYRHVL